jgi:hypothetical protein
VRLVLSAVLMASAFTAAAEEIPNPLIDYGAFERNVSYAYGYTNVFELGPLIDIRNTRLEFEGKLAG